MKRTTRAAVVALVMFAGAPPLVQARQEPQSPSGAAPGRAQRGARAQAEAQTPVVDGNAGELRDQVHRLLDQYPPGVAEMLRIDPTLAMNDMYMAAYPGLRALVAQRPEIVQNGRFFFGLPEYGGYARQQQSSDPVVQRARVVSDMFGNLLVLTGLLTLLFALWWLIKMFVDHRRWLRASKIQSDMQGRLLDRLTSNEDLVAFVQSPAGQRALETLTLPSDPKGRPTATSAPIGRILWSIQLGTVATLLGFGLMILGDTATVRTSWASDMSPLFFIMGIVTLSIGVGFLVSAGASFFISRRLGLLAAPASVDA